MTRLLEDTRKPLIKNLKDIKDLINNQTFLVYDPEKADPVPPCTDDYKAKNQSYGSIDKLKLRIVVRGGLQNKDLIGDTWSPTASTRTLKYLLSYGVKHKERVYPLDFIGSFLQEKFENGVFVKLDSRYAD